jgi:inorganic pyrophosphatase
MGNFPPPFYRWRPHPWHGLEVGANPPSLVHAYIEITPFDHVKYEIDKKTGYLRVDRPQRTSSHPPTLYGFVPRTYCGHRIRELSPKSDRGDGDPMDICVLTERNVDKAEVILNARVIGGMQMVDGGEADDKIIAVLDNDEFYGEIQEVSELPGVLVERLRHYFLTYKLVPGKENKVSIEEIYGREQAEKVIKASMEDYVDEYGG